MDILKAFKYFNVSYKFKQLRGEGNTLRQTDTVVI